MPPGCASCSGSRPQSIRSTSPLRGKRSTRSWPRLISSSRSPRRLGGGNRSTRGEMRLGTRVVLALLAVGCIALLHAGLTSDAHRSPPVRRSPSRPCRPLLCLRSRSAGPSRSPRTATSPAGRSSGRAAAVHTEPLTASPIVTTLGTVTPDETPNVLSVLGATSDSSGQLWVRVRLPLPNGAVGWVVGSHSAPTRR